MWRFLTNTRIAHLRWLLTISYLYITNLPQLMGNMIQPTSNKTTATHHHLPSTISSCLSHSRGLWGAEEHGGQAVVWRGASSEKSMYCSPDTIRLWASIAFHSSPAAVERKWNEKEKKEAKSNVEKDSKSRGKNKMKSFSIPSKCSMTSPYFTNLTLHPYFLAPHLWYLNSAVSLLSSI